MSSAAVVIGALMVEIRVFSACHILNIRSMTTLKARKNAHLNLLIAGSADRFMVRRFSFIGLLTSSLWCSSDFLSLVLLPFQFSLTHTNFLGVYTGRQVQIMLRTYCALFLCTQMCRNTIPKLHLFDLFIENLFYFWQIKRKAIAINTRKMKKKMNKWVKM